MCYTYTLAITVLRSYIQTIKFNIYHTDTSINTILKGELRLLMTTD